MPDTPPVFQPTDHIKVFPYRQVWKCSSLYPMKWFGRDGAGGGSTRQDFNLVILETCYVTKTIQMEKTDHDFFSVVGIG